MEVRCYGNKRVMCYYAVIRLSHKSRLRFACRALLDLPSLRSGNITFTWECFIYIYLKKLMVEINRDR